MRLSLTNARLIIFATAARCTALDPASAATRLQTALSAKFDHLHHGLQPASAVQCERVELCDGVVGETRGFAASDRGVTWVSMLAVDGETTITGSIGVIMQYTHIGELMDKIGIGSQKIASGRLKGEPDGFNPLSEEARKVYQGMIDDSYDWFTSLVAERRDMALDEVRALADGRVYTGRQALSNGLVDSLGGTPEARAWLKEEHDINPDLPVIDVDKSPRERLFEEFLTTIAGKTPFNEVLSLDGLVSLWQPNSY